MGRNDQKNNKSFTIITPSYNQGKYIEQTIKSVVSQGKKEDIEYLILDGGSSDNSLAVIERYSTRYPNIIKWRSKKDRGQVSAINEGLAKAKGDIVAYINSDDYYLDGTLSYIKHYFSSHPEKEWVIGDCKVDKKELAWTFSFKRNWPFQLHPLPLLLLNPINQPAVFLKRTFVKKVGKFNTKYKFAFDYDYWLRCTKISLPGRTQKKLALFRVHKESAGSTKFAKQFKEDLDVAKSHTNNKIIIFLHTIFSAIIIKLYQRMK